jgi:hypothetical protein
MSETDKADRFLRLFMSRSFIRKDVMQQLEQTFPPFVARIRFAVPLKKLARIHVKLIVCHNPSTASYYHETLLESLQKIVPEATLDDLEVKVEYLHLYLHLHKIEKKSALFSNAFNFFK